MARSPIHVQEYPEGITFSYRLSTPFATTLLIALWCVGGGLAVGVTAAVGWGVLDLTALRGASFGAVLLAGWGVGVLVLYVLVVLLPGSGHDLHVAFNPQAHALAVRLPTTPEWTRYRWDDVLVFRLVRRDGRLTSRCGLMMDTPDGPVTLLGTRINCYERGGLSTLAGYLNVQLNAVPATDEEPQRPVPARMSPHGGTRHVRPAARPYAPDLSGSQPQVFPDLSDDLSDDLPHEYD